MLHSIRIKGIHFLFSRDFCKISVFWRFKRRHVHHPRTHCNHWGYRKGSWINKHIIYKWNKELYCILSNTGENKSHENIRLMSFYTPNCSLVNLSSTAKWKCKNTWDVRPWKDMGKRGEEGKTSTKPKKPQLNAPIHPKLVWSINCKAS